MTALTTIVALTIGFLLGAAFMSILYERNVVGVQRRASNTKRISQLDVFELPEKLRPSMPPRGRSESSLKSAQPKE